MTWTIPPTFVSNQLLADTDLNAYLRDNPQYLYNAIPTRAVMWHDQAIVLTGNAISRSIVGSQAFNFYAAQGAGANGNSFNQSFYLQAGNYTLTVLGRTDNASGLIDWYIDGVLVLAGQDWYSSTTTWNARQSNSTTPGQIAITGSGYHVLKGVVNGKNASSSGYSINLTKYELIPVSD